MIFIVAEQKTECDYLQQQKEEEIRILSDEEKNITHGWFIFLKAFLRNAQRGTQND
jgi:hypothetical protein